jgi:hippurate hydrolase
MHNMPGVPEGHVVLRKGAFMASSDYVTVTMHGAVGHGGLPHQAQGTNLLHPRSCSHCCRPSSRAIPITSNMSVITVGAIHGSSQRCHSR